MGCFYSCFVLEFGKYNLVVSYSGQTASSSWSRAGNTQINAFIHTHTLSWAAASGKDQYLCVFSSKKKKKKKDGQSVADDFSSWHWEPSPAV